MVAIAVVAPTPIATVRTPAIVNARFLVRVRIERRTSFNKPVQPPPAGLDTTCRCWCDAGDEPDVKGILAFGERILPHASGLWVQASLDYKQRLQQLFFPKGIAFDGNRFNRTRNRIAFRSLAPLNS